MSHFMHMTRCYSRLKLNKKRKVGEGTDKKKKNLLRTLRSEI